MFGKILVPIDGSGPSDRALRLAGDIAEKFGAALILIHVLLRGNSSVALREFAESEGFFEKVKKELGDTEIMPDLSIAAGSAAIEVVPDDALKKIGHLLLERSESSVAEKKISEIKTYIRDGGSAEAILQCAHEENVDLIVTGSRGIGDLKSILLGSVSHKLAEDSECPCLVVK